MQHVLCVEFKATLHASRRWIACVGFRYLPGAFAKDMLITTPNPDIGLRVSEMQYHAFETSGPDWTVLTEVELRNGAEPSDDEICQAMAAIGFAREGTAEAIGHKRKATANQRLPFG